jgi:hypothetical protein
MAIDPSARSAANSPEDVLCLALRLRDHLDYAGVVALCDPASLTKWFDEYRHAVRPPTREELRRELPNLPDEKLDRLHAAKLAHFAQYSAVPRGLSYAEMTAVAPAEFALRWFENSDIRCEILRRLRLRGDALPAWAAGAELPAWADGAVPYTIGPAERLAPHHVRVPYSYESKRNDEAATVPDPDFEELRQEGAGPWRLIARDRMLQARGSTIIELPQELYDLLRED